MSVADLSRRLDAGLLVSAGVALTTACSGGADSLPIRVDHPPLARAAFDPREKPLSSDPFFIRLDDATAQPEFSDDPPLESPAPTVPTAGEDLARWTLTGGGTPAFREGHPSWRVENQNVGLISPPLDIPFRNLRAIELRFVASAGSRMRLWWSGGDTFADKGWSVVTEIHPGNGTLRAVVRTSSLRGYEGLRLSRIRFDPTDGEPADVTVESVHLIGREGFYESRGHGLGEETLGNELRNVLFQHTPARLSWRLTLPPGARLDLGAGILDAPADLVVTATVEDLGRSERAAGRGRSEHRASAPFVRGFEVLRERIGDTDSWHELSADLSRWEKRKVRLTLSAESSRTGQIVLWSNPIVESPGAVSPNRPNVLLYLIDTLRADHLGCYGGKNPTSPALDSLAAGGVLFERCSAAACWTRPSVVSILTSLAPPSHGVTDHGLAVSDAALTLPEQMRRAGYVTAGFITSTHSGASSNLQQGYDYLFELPAITGDPHMILEGRKKDFSRKNSSLINLKLLPWLDRQAGRPMFIYLHAMDPHAPYLPPEPYDRMFATGYTGAIDGSFDGKTGFDNARSREELDHVMSLYDGDIRFTDDRIGELVAELRRRSLFNRTLIVVVSDHGEEFFEHGGFEHGQSLHRELLDIPLIMSYPGLLSAGTRIAGRVSGLDLMPTILDIAGVGPAPDAQGRSLVPMIFRRATGVLPGSREGFPETAREPVFSWRQNKRGEEQVSVEKGDIHLILFEDGTTHLYDRSTDRDEQGDLSRERPELARSLADQARLWLASRAHVTLPGEETRVNVDADERKWLEALGYVK